MKNKKASLSVLIFGMIITLTTIIIHAKFSFQQLTNKGWSLGNIVTNPQKMSQWIKLSHSNPSFELWNNLFLIIGVLFIFIGIIFLKKYSKKR